MKRRDQGAGVARARALILVASLAAACTPQVSPSPTPAPSPSASPRLPTPVPTPILSAEPSPSGAAAEARLLIRLSSCSHTCGPETGSSIYQDGRAIWADNLLRPLDGRLTPAALQRVSDAIEATDALEVDGRYDAQLRPGAEPIPRGATLHRFERDVGDERVVVNSADAHDFADEPELWIVPPQVVALTDLVDLLRDPLSWLGADGFAQPPQAYEADRYLVLVDVFAGTGMGGLAIDVDDVEWPFSGPIEAIGEPFEPDSEGPRSRCLAIDAVDARKLVEAEVAAGAARRDIALWNAFGEYAWRRGGGTISVSTVPLLPHQEGTCEEVFTFVGEAAPA